MNDCLEKLHSLLENDLKIEVNTAKCSAIAFSKTKVSPIISYNNVLIPSVFAVKYLGIVLDHDLSWRSHIEYLCKRAELGLNILKSLAGLKWGSDPKILKMLYQSTIRSYLDYGCIYYSEANHTMLRKLDVIQNRALRVITGAMMSSPINSLELEAGVPPLSIRRAYLTDKYCLKLISRDNSVIRTYYNNITTEEFLEACNFNNSTTLRDSIIFLSQQFQDYICWTSNLYCFKVNFESIFSVLNISITHFESKHDFYEFLSTKTGYIKIYTDGSKTKDRTSFAYYDSSLNYGRVYKCSNLFSIFSAELLAIYYCIKYIYDSLDSTYVSKKFLIISDSMSALQALKSTKIDANLNYIVYEIKSIIHDIRVSHNNVTIELCWVPGHSGILGNELVDTLAQSEFNSSTNICDALVPSSDLVIAIRDSMILRWTNQLNFTRKHKGKWLAEIQQIPSTTAWFEGKGQKAYICRKFYTCISRLRIGHCRLPAHLNRLRLLDTSACEHCSCQIADINHIFLNCPKFNVQRLYFVANCHRLLNDLMLYPVNSLTILLRHPVLYEYIFEFVNNTIDNL